MSVTDQMAILSAAGQIRDSLNRIGDTFAAVSQPDPRPEDGLEKAHGLRRRVQDMDKELWDHESQITEHRQQLDALTKMVGGLQRGLWEHSHTTPPDAAPAYKTVDLSTPNSFRMSIRKADAAPEATPPPLVVTDELRADAENAYLDACDDAAFSIGLEAALNAAVAYWSREQ